MFHGHISPSVTEAGDLHAAGCSYSRAAEPVLPPCGWAFTLQQLTMTWTEERLVEGTRLLVALWSLHSVKSVTDQVKCTFLHKKGDALEIFTGETVYYKVSNIHKGNQKVSDEPLGSTWLVRLLFYSRRWRCTDINEICEWNLSDTSTATARQNITTLVCLGLAFFTGTWTSS